MDLLYKNEHITCLNYDKGPRPAIEICELSAQDIFEGNSLLGKIIFIMEGELKGSFGHFNQCDIPQGHMLFLPAGYGFRFCAEQTARFMVIRLLKQIKFCECYLLESLTRQTQNMNITEPETVRQKPFLLGMNRAMGIYTGSLGLFMDKGLCCKFYFETKTKELFYLLRAFYSKEQLARFFWDALSMDSVFSYFVANNYTKYKTLAQMAEATNMTLSGFEKRFKRVFSTPAATWISQQKAKRIYHAICNEQTPLKELSTRFGFSTTSTFSDFCKKNLGDTPGKIRKKIQFGGKEGYMGGKG